MDDRANNISAIIKIQRGSIEISLQLVEKSIKNMKNSPGNVKAKLIIKNGIKI